METLLLAIVIILQIVLIVLILHRDYHLLPEGLGVRENSQISQETAEKQIENSQNLWDNPPPASTELKLTVAEFKGRKNEKEFSQQIPVSQAYQDWLSTENDIYDELFADELTAR